jgi:hypothetical protein
LEGIQKLSDGPALVLSSRRELGRRKPTTGSDLPIVHATKSTGVEGVQGSHCQPDKVRSLDDLPFREEGLHSIFER